ncbi:hypothetical protein [Streptomyces dysideae]|uniref:Uncharacterized protein n=1 Tax=Streptomyces dysideae TaxID=909626 RepID=A0A101UXC5_9ACTN|nr:hypothetical protein [Streptomyces dysideae]KUO18609.1 hypothetical protein AQJ91_24390 [Streptomyces dysideae]
MRPLSEWLVALHTPRLTLAEQRTARVLDQRRHTCVRFQEAADAALVTRSTGPDVQRAYSLVLPEGPAEPATAAHALMESLRRHASSLDELDACRREFIESARAALSDAERGETRGDPAR